MKKSIVILLCSFVLSAGGIALESSDAKPSTEAVEQYERSNPRTIIINPQQGTAEDYQEQLKQQSAETYEPLEQPEASEDDLLPTSTYEEEEEIPVTTTQDSIREMLLDENDEGEENAVIQTEIISNQDFEKQQALKIISQEEAHGKGIYSQKSMEEEEEEDVNALPEDPDDVSKEVFSGEVAKAAPASSLLGSDRPDHWPEGEKMPRKSLFLNAFATDRSPRMFGISVIDSRSSTEVFGNHLQLKTPHSPLGKALGNLEYVNEVMTDTGFNIQSIDTDNTVNLLKLDAWIFPFMNVYIMGGHMSGRANIATNFSQYDSLLTAYGAEENMAFTMDYSGNNYGAGLTLVAPLGTHFYAMVDYNYLRTDLDVLKGHVKAETITALLGAHLSPRIDVFAGGRRTDIEQRVQGDIPNAMLPAGMSEMMIGQDATFVMAVDSAKDILPVVGGSLAFNDHFSASVTANFNKNGRFDGQNLSLGYRF